MSAIFGCINFDGGTLPPDDLAYMSESMRRWGADGLYSLNINSVFMGFANLSITPESLHESMPLKTEQLLFTSAARLDNRDELCGIFGIPCPDRNSTPDTNLVLKAYCKWGESAPRHLYGDWSFAACNLKEKTLFIARDHLGNTGLYYYYRPPFFAFSSDPEGLFALKQIERKINETKIAAYLTISPLGDADDTCWAGIKRLSAGCKLSVSTKGLNNLRYWNMNDLTAASVSSEDNYLAGFLDSFKSAVKSRLRSRYAIGSTLSAGLDSGAVTALAAQILGRSGETLHAFTSVPEFACQYLLNGALADEWGLASTVSSRFKNIKHHKINASNVAPIKAIERIAVIAHAPMHAAANMHWIMALLDQAQDCGVRVMLTGQLGNGGVSWSGGRDRILFLFASGRWDEGMKAIAEWKQCHGVSWISAITSAVVKPLLRPLRSRAGCIIGRGRKDSWSGYSAISPDFARRFGLREALKSIRNAPGSGDFISPAEERFLTLQRNGAMAGPIWHLFGSAFNMEVRDPTADIPLIEYCLSVPEIQHNWKGGDRMLIRRGMEGILPPEVQWSTVRGKQGADVALRLLHHREEMRAVLDRFSNTPEISAILDLNMMRNVWKALEIGVTAESANKATTVLLRGIMCGCFIEDALNGSRL